MAIPRIALRSMEYVAPDYLIAEAIKVAPSRYSNWCLGRRPVRSSVLFRLSLIFQCDPRDIIGWAEEGPDATAEVPCLEDGVDTALVRWKDKARWTPKPYGYENEKVG